MMQGVQFTHIQIMVVALSYMMDGMVEVNTMLACGVYIQLPQIQGYAMSAYKQTTSL
jgi:hypothetical protein